MTRLVVLTGGVGGAKLVLGLVHAMPDASITAIVNTGDDFEHLGLAISPDIDTLLYTLSGRSNLIQGWGRAAESWTFMAALHELGGETWFQLGDGDLALHVLRTEALRGGGALSSITARFTAAWNIGATILPMSDDPVRTMVDTDEGELTFQKYFVARRCQPAVREVRFPGAGRARPAPGVIDAIARADVLLLAPSNPYLSIDPILAVPGIREALERRAAPSVAVSPIVGGKAVKGPTTKLMMEFGIEISPAAIADHYAGLIDGLLVDERDPSRVLPIAQSRCDTLMQRHEDRVRVALAAVTFARQL